MFNNAIVKTPSPNMINGITSAKLGKPNYAKAMTQHLDYIQALKECGLKVTVLEADDDFPDSTFVEDVALCTPNCAIITNPGAKSRNKEVTSMVPIINQFYKNIENIHAPGTLEAGDIMMVGKHYYIGLSDRTNQHGAKQMITFLNQYGMQGSLVKMKEFLHLKTGVNYLENNNLLATGEFLTEPDFAGFNIHEVPNNESYATNSVWVNGTVLTPKGFPKTKSMIQKLGYKIREIDVSEFQKLDGGLSCLSLRF